MADTPDEILADINKYVGADESRARELAETLRERSKQLAQALINVGVKGTKKEFGPKVTQLESQLAESKQQLESVNAEFAAFKERSPSIRDLEDNEKRKWEPRVKQEKERADKAEANAKNLRSQVFEDKLAAQLTREDVGGTRLDNDPLIVRAIVSQYRDRHVQRDDGTEDVLQIDNDTPYDGRTMDDKIGALADAARRKVNAKFLVTTADNGGGVRNSGNSGITGSGLKTQDQITEQKRQDPAFAGL